MKGVSTTLLSSDGYNAIVVCYWRLPGVLERSAGSSAGHPAKLGGSVPPCTTSTGSLPDSTNWKATAYSFPGKSRITQNRIHKCLCPITLPWRSVDVLPLASVEILVEGLDT